MIHFHHVFLPFIRLNSLRDLRAIESILFFVNIFKMYMKREKGKERGRERASICYLLIHSKIVAMARVRLKPSARKSTWVSHTGVRDPSTWGIIHCLPMLISRKLNQKLSSWGLTWCCDMRRWHYKCGLNYCATMSAPWKHFL